ncbi:MULTISPECIES: hypothetical protein [Aquimarina]|uniref:hypothetical protein n=1 Tax=Aquimarina TaxID=290174 RepID=UPI000CDEAB8C|nr:MULTISPECIES: hypothetical protein [Aquimarina]
MKSIYKLLVFSGLCCCLSGCAQQEDKSLLFSCFDSEKTSEEWFSYLEKELVANEIINKRSEIYWDLYTISLFNNYDREFDSSQVEIINKIYHNNQITTQFLAENDHCFQKKSKRIRELSIFKQLAKADVIFFKKIDSLRMNSKIEFKTKKEEYKFYKAIVKEVYSDTYFKDENFKIFLLMELYYYFNKEDLKILKNQRKKLGQLEDGEETVPVMDDENHH